MSKNYEDLAKKIIENVGGASNVNYCTHCMTRLRFLVENKELVDMEKINALDVAGCVWVENQLQIIIGADVNKLYPVVCKIGNFEGKKAEEENLDTDNGVAGKKSLKDIPVVALKAMGECIAPVIPAFIAYGMFASLCAILGPEGIGILSAESGIYILFDMVRNAFMYFIPMLLGYSSAKRFGCTPVLAMTAIACMLYPDFMAMISEGTYSLFGITPIAVTLNGQIIPVILMCWIESYWEKLLDKVLPSNFNLPFKGLFTLILIVPLMILGLTPLGTLVGNALAGAISALYNVCGPLVTCIIGFLWLILIIPGMHMAVISVFMMGFFTTGVDYVIMPIMFPLCFVASAANLAILFRTKNKKEKEMASTGIVALLFGGVVEPSLYSLYLIYPRTLISCCIGMGVSGLLMGLMNVGCYAFTSTNFLALTSFIAGGIPNIIKAVISIIVGMVVAFALIMVFGMGKQKE